MNMISTGAFLPEMDASNKQETIAEKFARVWEKKNSKVARAGGVSLMALSLAACGSSSTTTTTTDTSTDTSTDTTPVTPTNAAPVALTSETLPILGTAENDTYTGTSTTFQAADVIIDSSSADSDALNLTLTAAMPAAVVSGIEAINIDWNAFAAATVDAANVSGATITVSSSKLGYLGNTVFNNAGENTVAAGAGAVGSMDVNGGTAVTVNATNATTVTVDGSGTAADNVSATVTAGASTTTVDVGSATAFIASTVVGGAATTTIEVNGTTGTADTANVTMVNDGTLAVLTAEVETVSVTANAGQTITLADASVIDDLTISSAGAVTLVASSDELTKTAMAGGLTDSTTGLTIELTSDGAADLSAVNGVFDQQNALQGDTTFASGATIQLDIDQTGAVEYLATGTGTSDVLNMNITVDQTTIDVVDGTNDFETVRITATHAATETDGEIDINYLMAAAVEVSGASKVAIGDGTASATDDFVGDSVDASALTGAFSFTEIASSTDDITVVGSATAGNTIVFGTTTGDTSYTGGNSTDDVTMAQTTGDSTAVLGNGVNSYTNASLTDGTAVVLGGTGVDTVDITITDSGADTGNIIVQTGDGNDDITVNFAGADETADVEMGGGDDTFTFDTTATGAGDTIAIDGGEGSGDSIDINDIDISLGSITLTGIETIDDSGGAGTVDAALLTGKSYEIKGDGSTATLLDVVIGTAGTFDFSGLTLNNSLTDGIGGLSVTTTGADTITGTTGTDTLIGADVAAAVVLNGGRGKDTYTLDDSTAGNAGTATVQVAAGDSGVTTATADVITDFETTVDALKMGTAGSVSNFYDLDTNTGATDQIATVELAVAAANAATGAGTSFDGTIQYIYVNDSASGVDSYLVADMDLDGTADLAIEITAIADGALVAADIIA